MSSTIVDRILAEYSARKSSREAILKGKTTSDPAKKETGEDVETLLMFFEKELAPVIGRAVSTEIREALDGASKEILRSLQLELSRSEASPPPDSPPMEQEGPSNEELEIDTIDTDLDLPAEEVNRQLDRVFGNMKDPLERFSQKEPPLGSSIDQPEREPEPLADSGSDFTAENEKYKEEDNLEPPTVDLPGPILDSLNPAGEDLFDVPLPKKEDLHPADQLNLSDVCPASLSEIPQPLLPGGREQLEAFQPENESADSDALLPDISEEVSRIVKEIERGQARISGEMSHLNDRVANLEAISHEQQDATEKGPSAATVPEKRSTATPESSDREQSGGESRVKEGALSPSQLPSKRLRKSSGRAALLALQETILHSLQEMEKRLMERMDSIQVQPMQPEDNSKTEKKRRFR